MTGRITRGLLAWVAVLSLARAAVAQSAGGEAGPSSPHPQTPQSPADFGDRINTLQIPASSFVPRCSGLQYTYSGSGYLYVATNPCPFSEAMWATVTLPTGAEILFLDLYYDDTDAANDLEVFLNSFTNGSGIAQITSASSTGSSGIGYANSPLISYIVNNDVQYDSEGRILTVVLYEQNPSIALKFKGADIWWRRIVSPAPALASFNDVPTDHPFFRYIEALLKSGITGGCGGNNYCPDNPVTRGQMAVFLAKALGLSWYDQSGLK